MRFCLFEISIVGNSCIRDYGYSTFACLTDFTKSLYNQGLCMPLKIFFSRQNLSFRDTT